MIRTLISLVPATQRSQLLGYGVLTLLSVVLRAASCLLLVPLLSALFGPTPSEAWPWVGWLTVVTVAAWLVDYTLARIGYGLGFALMDTTQRGLTERLTRIPLSWFDGDNTAAARQSIAATAPDLVGMTANLVTPIIGAVLLPAAIAIGLFFITWQLGVAALIALPLLLGALWASMRIVRAADAADAAAHSALTERILEFARTQQALRAARRVTAAHSHTGAAVTAAQGATRRLLLFQIPGQVLFSIASQIGLIALAGTVVTLAVRGQLSAPEAVALLVVTVRYLEPFTVLSELATAIESARGLLDRLRSVQQAPAVSALADPDFSTETRSPRVEFRNVGFGYGDGPEVVSELNFTLEPGSTTAVVGPSGSGKSTIVALLAGLHTPTSGQILIDGTDLADLDPATRAALPAIVFQHPYLFDGPIEDNVRVGHPQASAEELSAAMRLARVDVITARLPDGERSRVGEAGTGLSGGERQRVSIARALVKPSGLLLVDEGTSALDNENEAAITRAIAEDPQARTRVIIAHRLGAISHADQVLFVDGGRIVEQGAIDALATAGGRFAEFWRQRQDSAGWQIAATN